VKLTVLAARIGAGRQLGKQRAVEAASGKIFWKLAQIDCGDMRLHTR
jgi:hypothetical protein